MTTTPEQITDLISGYTDLKNYFENCRTEMQPFMAAVQHPNQVVLEVGPGRNYAHPSEAMHHINNHVMRNNIHWKIVLEPDVYTFPYNNANGLHFSHGAYATISGRTQNSDDVVLEYNGDHHQWLVASEFRADVTLKYVTLRDPRALTFDRITAINNRNMVNNNAGGLVHGVVTGHGAVSRIRHCNFTNLGQSVSTHSGGVTYVDDCDGHDVWHALLADKQAHIHSFRCNWAGVPGPNHQDRHGSGIQAYHGASVHAWGQRIHNFYHGLLSHWGGDLHCNRSHDWGGDDGRTPVNIKINLINNCYHGVGIAHGSQGHITDIDINNSYNFGVYCSHGSSAHIHSRVRINGAKRGVDARHMASIQANDSSVKNCSEVAYSASHIAEIHAANTSQHLSGNAVNYTPGPSHSVGDHGGQIYYN